MSGYDGLPNKSLSASKEEKMEQIFAPVMSPSWSKNSRLSKKSENAEKDGKPATFKDKIKKIFD